MLYVVNARIYGGDAVVKFDAAVAFHVGPGCSFPTAPTWVSDAGAGPKPPPLVVGDLVFVAGGNAPVLSVLDGVDGTVLRAVDLQGSAYSPPILADGAVVVGDGSGRLNAFDVDGGCPERSFGVFGGRRAC